MTTGGYPPPQPDPNNPGPYPGAPSYGGQQPGYQPNDYTQHIPNPIQSGYQPEGAPQGGAPQYGAPQQQFGGPQYGAPQQQFGAPQYGDQQNSGPQYGAPQFGAGGPSYPAPPSPGFDQYPGFGPTPGSQQPGQLLPRLGARIIDGLIVAVPMGILNALVIFSSGSGVLSLILSVLTGVIAFGYFTYLESTQGATFGKKLLGLSVVGPNGGNPTMEEAAKRNAFVALQILNGIPFLGLLASLASLAAYIGIAVTIEQDGNKQGFHDKFAGGTRVVKS